MSETDQNKKLIPNTFELVECVPAMCNFAECTFCMKGVTEDGSTFKGCGGALASSTSGLSEDGCRNPSKQMARILAYKIGLWYDDIRLVCRCTGNECNGGSSTKHFTVIQTLFIVFTMTMIFA